MAPFQFSSPCKFRNVKFSHVFLGLGENKFWPYLYKTRHISPDNTRRNMEPFNLQNILYNWIYSQNNLLARINQSINRPFDY